MPVGTPHVSSQYLWNLLRETTDLSPNTANYWGQTALHHAASWDADESQIGDLIRLGGDIDIYDECGFKPIHWAAYFGCSKALAALNVQCQRNIIESDLLCISVFGRVCGITSDRSTSPWSCQEGEYDAVLEYALRRGADPKDRVCWSSGRPYPCRAERETRYASELSQRTN